MSALKPSSITSGYIHVRGAKVYDEHGKLIDRKETKTAKSTRDVPIMIPRLTELVKACDTEYLMPYSPSSAQHPLNTICRNNDLPEVGLHGLRHSYASLCYHLGLSEKQTMEYGGWSDATIMHKIYTHLADIDREVSETRLQDFFKNKSLPSEQ